MFGSHSQVLMDNLESSLRHETDAPSEERDRDKWFDVEREDSGKK